MSLRRVPRCNFGTQNSMNSFYDLVIVGGGLVGSAMACKIGKSSLLGAKKILLLDSDKITQKVEKSTNQYSNRVSAISPSSVRFFKRFGIWDNIKPRAQAVSTLYVEDGQSGSKIFFEELGSHSPVAFIVENHIILQELKGYLQTSCPNVEWRRESTFDKISIPENLAQNVFLQLNDGQKTECSLLIAADGANSKVREISGIGHNVKDYDQMAIVATLELTPSGIAQNTTAWQRFMPNGPVAILPLKNHLSSLVWTTSTEEAKRLLGISSHLFVEELNSALTSEMHIKPNSCLKVANYVFNSLPFLKDSPKLNFPTINSLPYDDRAAFPLSFIRVEDYIRHRVALIGDAAHRIHPLAGQGVNLGWSDVNNLTKTLELACKRGEDLGSLACLKEYDNRSQQRNVPMMTAIDSLNHMFTSNSAPVVFLRSAGFSLLDRMLPVKDLIARFSS